MENRLTEHQYVYQHLTYILESLRDDTKVGSVVKGYLMRNDFFTNNKIELYFTRKEKKVKEKITTETTLNMANQRLALATKEAESSTHPVEVYNNSNTQTKDFSCYLDEIPPHAEYSHMGKDWIMNGINLSNNLKEIGIIKRGHFNFSDTDCTSQISNDHWDKSIIPFLTNHKLKNAFSTKDDEQMLINMFGEEDKKKLLEPGNLNLIYSLTKIEEDAIKVLEIVSRIRLVLYLRKFSVCQTLTSLEKKWPTSLPSDLLDKRLRDILWASELIKWDHAMAGWYFSKRDERAMDQNTVSILTPRAIETTLKLSKIKAKTRVDGLDDDEEFENVWVELKGGFGNYHEAENQNNCENLDVLLKGFSIMSAMQALTLPEDAKENISDLEFFGIRGIGNHFQFWGSFQASQYFMCSYLLEEFRLPSFEGREGSSIQDLLYAIKIVYSFKVRVKASKLKFHQIRALARSKRIFEGDSSPIKAKRTRDHHTNLFFTTKINKNTNINIFFLHILYLPYLWFYSIPLKNQFNS
ncbi:hypothetical protein C2G38_2219635 [Gigaspora rosea]|uniref:Uncharacterized protein n=1 Tax=Gigaspora rosea TaxID=44941 RepID=A0A397UEA1_9GLOM|nr:hypothetical protein C2G38_2219635 [Gigaspora rosea]